MRSEIWQVKEKVKYETTLEWKNNRCSDKAYFGRVKAKATDLRKVVPKVSLESLTAKLLNRYITHS
jgi:hypothetical protein